MKKTLPSLLLLALLTIPATAQQSAWSKYVPKNQRKEIIKKSSRTAGGIGRIMATGLVASALWVTESLACVIVSDAIDRERLTPEEADQKYTVFRPDVSSYRFLINVIGTAGGPFPRGPRRGSEIGNPLPHNEIFLQRSENHDIFSKGKVGDQTYDVFLGTGGDVSSYLVEIPKLTRSGEPVIRSLDDKIELQFTLPGRPAVLEYKPKDLVKSLDDL